MRKNLLALFIAWCLCFIVLEVFLRLFNPFPFRIKGNSIILPANQKYFFINKSFSKLDKEILHTKNGLGFRGRELPKDFIHKLSIVVVGGSTTECYYLNDNKTWPSILEQELSNYYNDVWLNNAGLDGHSTYGHGILLTDYLIQLKPKSILFLIGSCDVGRDDLNNYDKSSLIDNKQVNGIKDIVKKSEVVSTVVNIYRKANAMKRQLGHLDIDFLKTDSLEIPPSRIQEELEQHKKKYLKGYKQRIVHLINVSRENGIDPIFITQPTIAGMGFDRITGVNLETIKKSDSINGKLYWETLQLYNGVLKEVSRDNHCLLVDLAILLPKDSLYFYDWVHFTNEGAQKVADIVCNELRPYLDKKYGVFIKD